MTNTSVTVGLLHPGEMGVTVGATVVGGGARVLWASEERSATTRSRALEAGLEDAGPLASVVRQSRVVLSVVPPHGALALARTVAALGFRGLYVDGNAVAPETAREIGRVVEGAGARFVDGGIIGPAARKRGTTRFYLSGPAAPEVAILFSAGPIDAIVLDAPAGAASALKMAYAGWTKGSSALLAAIRAFAMAEDVDSALLSEWKISQPDVPARSERAFTDNARKAWRFRGRDGGDRAVARRNGPAGGLSRRRARDLRAAVRVQGHEDPADRGGGRPEAAPQPLSLGVGGCSIRCGAAVNVYPWRTESRFSVAGLFPAVGTSREPKLVILQFHA